MPASRQQSTTPEKPFWRKTIRRRLASISAVEANRRGMTAARLVLNAGWFRDCAGLAVYLSTGREVTTAPIIRHALSAGKNVAVPAWNPELNRYCWAHLDAGTACRTGAWRIPEPAKPQWLADGLPLNLALIPGLAFDGHGARLGRGGGFYDRLLSGFDGLRVGLALELQRVEKLPVAAHDQPVDMLVTEKGIEYFRNNKHAEQQAGSTPPRSKPAGGEKWK